MKPNTIPSKPERVLIAAIWYKELPGCSKCLPRNIQSGTVLTGYRHHSIINTLYKLTGKRTVTKGDNAVGKHIQGFLTTNNKFVSRKRAMILAYCANQLTPEHTAKLEANWHPENSLYSEDLY